MTSLSSSSSGGDMSPNSLSRILSVCSVSLYRSLQYSVHLSFIFSLSIKIFPCLSLIAISLGCHFLFILFIILNTSLVLYSPAYCSMSSHCFSNHFCLSFLAENLTSLHNFLYSIVACSDSFALSLIFLFSVANFNVFLLIDFLFGCSAKGIVASTACCIISQSLVAFPSILSFSISASLILFAISASYLALIVTSSSAWMFLFFSYFLLVICFSFSFKLQSTRL